MPSDRPPDSTWSPLDPPPEAAFRPGSSEWWLARLGRRLDDRQDPLTRFDEYYTGERIVLLSSYRFKRTFGDRFPDFIVNYMATVVNAERQRLVVQGVRMTESESDDQDAWRWWQENHLDADSQTLHLEALTKGIAYTLVWPDADGVPQVTIESPLQMVVETAPGQRWKRLAAMKRWMDDSGRMFATLYLPDRIEKWQWREPGLIERIAFAVTRSLGMPSPWEPRQGLRSGEDAISKNELGVVPVVAFVNRPQLARLTKKILRPDDGQSELKAITSAQDAINTYRMLALVSSEYAAFRQRWAIGLDIPINPETNQPISPIDPGVDVLWNIPPARRQDGAIDPDAPEARFGEFEQTDTSGIRSQIDQEVQHIVSVSQTPYHILYPQPTAQPPSGESIKSSEAGLVDKVQDAELSMGEGWEETIRLKYLWEDDPRGKAMGAEIIWKDPERHTEAEHIDALMKMKALGAPDELLLEDAGWSPQKIRRARRLAEQARLRAALTAPPSPPAQPLEVRGADGQVISTIVRR